MKIWIMLLTLLLLPLSAGAMTPVADRELAEVTGQAGVNINPDVTLDISIGTMAWGDADGVAGPADPPADGGYVGLSDFTIRNLVIRTRTGPDDACSTCMPRPMTIDVATSDGSDGKSAGSTFVRFGLGSLRIGMDELSYRVSLFGRTGGSAGTDALDALTEQKLGVAAIGTLSMSFNPASYVDFFSHGAMGVSFDVNLTLDHLSADYLSWGDTDGLGSGVSTPAGQTGMNWMDAGTTAGYVGLRNLRVGGGTSPALTGNGVVQVDVVTTKSGIYSRLPAYRAP